MKAIVYCQHTLGVGHFFRTLEICRALHAHKVLLITGGPSIDMPLPAHVREVKIPGLQMDREFKGLYATDPDRTVDDVKQERRKILFDLFRKERPDLFLIELFPFGRKKFRFELEPVLEGIHNGGLPSCRVICSLRDILVEKDGDKRYENRVIHTINAWFDAVMVHADPLFVKLDRTFPRLKDIRIPVVYTGFICPQPMPSARNELRKRYSIDDNDLLIVASAGGGKVGSPLMEAIVGAHRLLDRGLKITLQVFTGPYMDEKQFRMLEAMAGGRVVISRFTTDFLSWMAAADLSVSMAGYNTCMNILATGTPALVWPFGQNREQRLRAEKLAGMGRLTIINDQDLEPQRMKTCVEYLLKHPPEPAGRIALDGAAETVKQIEQLLK